MSDFKRSQNRPHIICHMVQSIDGRVTGDFLYGEKIDGVEYKLWAKSISFPHPYTGRMLEITCDSGL